MGSCVSKKAARAGAVAGASRGRNVAAPLPAAEKESARHALPPPVAEADVEREEVKEVVLSEMPVPRPPRPPPPEPEPVKRSKEQPEAESEEACSASDTASSVDSAAKEKEKAMAKLQKKPGAEREPEKKVVSSDAPKKKGRMAPEETERERKPRDGGGNGRAMSPSPLSAHRRQQPGGGQQHPPAPLRPRREHPHVVSGIGCRSGRFSPSAARRAAESVVRRTHSAREADMALPSSKRSLTAAINGGNNAGGYSGAPSRRDPGERSGRRSDSPTGSRRAPASPGATHRPASPMRKAAKEHAGTPERASRPRVRDGGNEQPPALAGLGERNKKVAEGEEGAALGQNPSVAMECFIFL